MFGGVAAEDNIWDNISGFIWILRRAADNTHIKHVDLEIHSTQLHTQSLCVSLFPFLQKAMPECSVSNESLALVESRADSKQLPALSPLAFNVQTGL